MPKNKKILSILKYSVVFLSVFYIVHKLVTYEQKELFFDSLKKFSTTQIFLLLFVLLLSFPNWGLEAFKWKKVTGNFEPTNFKNSFKSVLSGLFVSLFTPNRIGEIPGRSLFLKKQNRKKGIAAAVFSSACQISTTIFFGITGFLVLATMFPEVSIININVAMAIGIFLLVLLTSFILWPTLIMHLIDKIPFVKKRSKKSFLSESTSLRYLTLKIFSLSNLRYILFFFQFYFLIRIFNVDVNLIQSFVAVSLSYFIMLFIPVISLADVGVRGSAAIYCFGLFTQQISGILMATFSLWIINIAIPALVGGYFVRKIEIVKYT